MSAPNRPSLEERMTRIETTVDGLKETLGQAVLEIKTELKANTRKTEETAAATDRIEKNTSGIVAAERNVRGWFTVSSVITSALAKLVGFLAKLGVAGGLVAGAWKLVVPHLPAALSALWSTP